MPDLGAADAGQLYEELVRRGLIQELTDAQKRQLLAVEAKRDKGGALNLAPRMTQWQGQTQAVGDLMNQGVGVDELVASDSKLQNVLKDADSNRIAARLKEMSAAVSAVRDLFGANGRPDAPMAELMNALDALTQGGATWMNGGNMEMMVRRIQALSDASGGVGQFLDVARRGGALASSVGLDRSFGMQTAQSATAFGKAFGEFGGSQGFGGLTKQEATALDQQLRTAAARSPMANALGALLAVEEQGLLPGQDAQGNVTPAAQLAAAVRARDPAAMAQLARMTPQDMMQVLQQSGVSGSTAAAFLNAREANQEVVSRAGLADVVRGMQGQGEVANLLRNRLEGGMAGGFAEAGFTNAESAELLPRAAEAARQALMNMDGDLISNPSRVRERNAQVMAAVRAAIGDRNAERLGDRLQAVVASAIRGVEDMVRRNPSLKKFGNLAGVITMNRGDVLAKANEEIMKADAAADVASLTSGLSQGSPLARAMDAIAKAGDDTKIVDVVAQALGGADKKDAAAAIAPKLQEVRAKIKQYETARGRLGQMDPQAREKVAAELDHLRQDIEAQVSAVRGLAQEAGVTVGASGSPPASAPADSRPGAQGGGAGPAAIKISGNLTLKQDGTADLDGASGGAGQAAAPAGG